MILSYIYDFISFMFERELKDEIKSIILFGSVASGEFDKNSDIDLFIEIWDDTKKEEIEKKIKEKLNRFEEITINKWQPRGIDNNLSITMGDLSQDKWENLRYDIISNGILIYGKFKELPKNLDHKVLISFSMKDLTRKQKMRFLRQLYGYKTKKKDKIYSKEGMIDKYDGQKISSNSIIVPIQKVKEFRKLFSKHNISPKMREIWIRND